jgi:hypothetical protein
MAAVVVARAVEMYAWVEHSSSQTTTNVGGSQTTTTTYSYSTEWVNQPARSSDFQEPQGHENPALPFADAEVHAPDAMVGGYALAQPDQLEFPSASTPVTPSDANFDLSHGGALEGEFLYLGAGSLTAPAVGDVRVTYTVLPVGTDVTVFGQQTGTQLAPYTDRQGHRLYRMFAGTRDEAVAMLHSESNTARWILRGVGFLMLWIGLALLFGPISVLMSVIPPLGEIGSSVIGGITFVVAVVLTLVTVLVSSLAHSPFALVVLLVIAVGAAAFGVKRWLERRPPKGTDQLAAA